MADIEKQFFEEFGIKPERGCTAYDKFTEEEADIICNDHCQDCLYFDNIYPPITDHILLALVCVALEYRDYPTTVNIRNIKERTLRLLIGTKKYLKDTFSSESYHNRLVRKVQAIFKK